jgi:hypothetical protein
MSFNFIIVNLLQHCCNRKVIIVSIFIYYFFIREVIAPLTIFFHTWLKLIQGSTFLITDYLKIKSLLLILTIILSVYGHLTNP